MGLDTEYKQEGNEQENVNQQHTQQNNTQQEQEFVDNSPEAIEGRRLQEIADNSPDSLAMVEWIAGLNTEGEKPTPPPNLKSPLFKQHMRLKTLAMLPEDRFVKGSSGEGVFAVQQALHKLYPEAKIGQYGIYGDQTIALVKKFQKEEGLRSDGDFGQQTLLALDQYSFPRVIIEDGGASMERVEGFEVKEELHRPAKISATASDLAIAQGQETLEHQDIPKDKGIHHNQDISGVRIYSDPTKNSKLKFTLNYDTDVTLVGEYAYESSWSLIQAADGKEGWINSDYVTQGTTAISADLAQSDLSMIGEEQDNLGEVVQDRYGSAFVQEQDARLIIHAIASLNDGRAAMYYKEEAHELSWWERMLLDANEEEARTIYQNIGIRTGMNLMLPSEDLIFQMRDAGLISSGSTEIDVQGAIDFLKMSGGFSVGILEGLWDGLVGTLKAIPDLLKMIWDVVKSAFQGVLFTKLGEIVSSIWEFIKNLPQNADAWWQEFKQKSPFEQGKSIGKGVGMIAFEVILAIFSGGAVNALKATGVGAKIVAASSKIKNTVARFGDDIANVSQRMLNDMGDVVLPKQVVTPDGRVFNMKRNDLLDDGRPQNSMMKDGDGKDGGGKKSGEEEERKKDKLVPSIYQLSTPKVQGEIDDLGKLLSKKDLSDVEADLLSAGWVKEIDGNITKFTLRVPIGNGYDKKYIMNYNSSGVEHSINGQPTKYWKLYEDKKSSKKVLFRSSNDTNFQSGGHGKTFMNGIEQ